MPSSAKPVYVVAVSGGIDSVVLLDMLMTGNLPNSQLPTPNSQIIVAHFDHGIRPDSAEDEVFVRTLAKQYDLPYYSRREELGAGASEDMARQRRYAFLHKVATQHQAQLVTAHHANDVVETVAINLTRGTGWRGLAVMDMSSIWRPLLGITKAEIRAYAARHNLQWREDSTNSSGVYLRNQIRRRKLDEDSVWQTLSLRARQVELKRAIDHETIQMIGYAPYSRYFFTHCGDGVAIELLRAVCLRETGVSPVLAVRARLLHAIKVARAGTTMPISGTASLAFTRTHFVVQNSTKVL